MKLAPLSDFLLHDVLGNLAAAALIALSVRALGKIKHRAARTHNPGHHSGHDAD
ncbi:hypothetical protein C5F59_004995 [Streptomyces sp. QL37]|uniref:hypothetical protein n=1 Tax=Streptomyces sp. QL37 TaxID=2093747 RepID=UPI001374CACA|nr:hypothetical protein [Streptomyces sp. QL37]